MEDNLKKVWQALSEDYELPDYDTFREDMKNEDNLRSLWTNAKKNYDLPEYEQFKADMFGDDEQAGDSQYFDNDGTVVDQAVDNTNRMTGHMPQAVQDASFNGPVYNQRVNPPGGQAMFTEEELAEQIAATQKENQPTINATDISGMAWTNAEVANMRNERKRENPNKGVTYQQKESWTGSYARTPDEFGEMHYGWQRGQRVKRLNKQGVEFAGYGGHKGNQYYNEALDAAERMSDDEIVATYEKISKSLGPDTDLRWLANTEEGYKAASQLKALQHELHARDLGFAHDRDVENPGMEDYASVRTDQMVADRIDALASMSPQERDALAQEAYDRNLDSEGMALDDQNTMLAVAALRSKENGRRVEDNYRELTMQVEQGSLYSTLERDMDSIFNEESAAMVQREEDAVGDMVYSGGEGGEMAWAMGRTVEAIKAGNLPDTFNTMTNRLLGESEAARRFYDRRVGELSRQVGIIQARAMARDELRQMFRTKYIEGNPLTPKSDAQYIAQSVLFDNMWSKMSQASLGLAAGASYHEMKKTLDEGMQMYAQQQASTAARIIAPCAVLVFDAATGSFFPASYASKGVTTLYSKGVNNALGWLGKRLFGIGTEAAVRRAGENTALRIFGSALGGAANFATYEFESELFGGAATGTLSADSLTHAAVGGAGKGFVFGFVGGVAGKATEGLTGFNALLGEVGTIAAEGTVFTAMDYLSNGHQLTPEVVGTSFGMAIAGRMAHPVEYATNLLSRVVGINAKNAPNKPPRISKEMQARLQDEYPALTALLSGDGLAKDIAKAIKTKGGKQNAQERMNAIEEEYRRLKFDKNVPWGVVRIAEYVVNGRVIPQPWMMNSEIRTDGDGNEYGVTLDGEGRTIEEYRFRDEKDRDKWLAATSRQSDINRLMVANQNLRRSEFTDILESTINEVAEAQGMDANVLRDVVRGGDIKKKEYRKTIKDKAYLSAAEEVQKAVDAKLESTESAADIALRAVENKYGISIEQALEYPVYQRTEREAKAVEELQQRLNGDYSPENDMSDAELIEAEKAEARDEGYNTEGGDRAGLKERLEDAAASLSGMGINPADIDKMDDAALAQWMQERDMDAGTAAAVMEYQNAKAAFEGVRDRLQDDAQKRIEESNRQTDERTNSGSGMIHRVTVKPDNENDTVREGFVIEGKIAVNEDGTVDLENSDKEVVVAYSDGSKPEMRPISDVLTGEQPLDPKEVKQKTADGIMTELTEKAASDMNRDLPFNLGDVYDVMVEGQPMKATVVGEDQQQPGNVVVDFSNGQRGSVPKDALQGMADDYREAQRRPQRPIKEEEPIKGEQPKQEGEAPQGNEEPGQPVAPPVGGDPAERVAYYRASGKSEERIAKEIANNLAAARERLEKAQKEWEESTETDDAVLDALERARDEAKREVEYWEEVGRIKDTAPEEEVIEEQPAEEQMPPVEEPAQDSGTENPAPGFSEADKKFWSREGEDIVEVMDEAARQMGLAVVTYDDPNGENGYIQGGKIYLNSAKGRAAIGFVMGHEMTHEMQERDKANGENGNLYTQFRELALEHAKSVFTPRRVKDVMCNTYEDYLNARYNQYQEHIRETTRNREFEKAWKSGLSNEEATAIAERAAEKAASEFTMDDLMDETVSDVAGSMLADPDMARRALGLEKDLDRLHKYKEAIMDWLEKILARMTGRGEEYEQMKRLQQSLQDLWSDAVKKNRGDRSQDQRRRYSLDTHAQQFGLRYEKGEDGSTHFYEDLGRDADGNPILGREITRFMPVHIENSPVGAVLRQGLKDGIIDKEQYNRTIQNQCAIMQYFKDTADLDTFFAVSGAIGFAQMPPTGNEKVMRDYYRMDKQGRAVFVPYKSNSETQYGNTFDVTTICRKTQTMIDVMSETMKAQKHGLTVDEVIKVVYDNVYKMGKGRNEDGRDIMVPCNVCYVFNRWVNLGNLFDTMRQLRDRYSDMSVEQIRKERVKNIQGLVKEYEKQGNELEYRKYADYLTALDEWANASVADRAADKAAGDITKTRLEEYGKTVAKLMKDRLVEVDSELDALNIKLFNYERAANKADAEKFTAADRKRMEQLKNEKNYLEKGTWFDYVRLQDDYKPIPDDILFDINRSYEFKEHYAGAWKYRTTRGSGMGKAAAAYSPEYFGSGIVGAAMDADSARDMSKNLFMVREPGTDGKWHYKYIDEETWTLKPEAVKLLRKAQDKAAAQNYLNGQRFQSTSDARVEYLTDYNTYMLEQMLIGSKGQGFTKVPECAKLFGDTGTMFNLSLIAKGKGYEDLTQEQYDALDEEDKKDCAMIDGVWRHALYSDVSGINHGDAFALSDAYPNLQPIMVTINNIHARLCMALASTGRITFNIPYHASGDTESYYLSKAETTGDSMDMTSRADYSDYETDKVIDPGDKTAATARSAFAKIKTGADLTKAEMAYLRNLDHDNVLRQLYMRFRGEDVDGGPARILNKYLVKADRDTADPGYGSRDSQCRIQEWDGKTGEFLTDADGNPVYKQVKLSGGKDGTANLLMTNDYWDKTLTLAQADQNGQAFLDLCEQLGYRPRFSGWKKDKNKGWMYDPDFDFTKCTGYWSNLIDISMYDQQGNPITQGKIDASAIGTPHFKKDEMTDLNGRRLTAMETNPGIDSEVMRDIVRQNVTDVAARRAREKAEFAQIVRDWANDKRGNKGALFGGKRGDIIPSWIRNEWDRNPQFVKEVAKMAKLSPEMLERQKARNIEDAIQHAQDTMDEYYGEGGETDATPRWSLIDDPVERKRMADVEFSRMGEEERGELIDESRRFSLSTDLDERFGSRWIDEQTEESGKHTTQVPSTIGSYRKFADFVKRDSGGRDDIRVLDASSGLGHGTRWMRENGIDAEDVEPYPSKDREAPTYASYDDVKDDYDYIISNCVLNVIPEDWRRDVLHNMADKLKVGGKMIINVRGADSIRKQGTEGKSRITLDDPSEILVLRPNGSIRAYQKGFTKQELKDWCENELGDGYQVEVAGKKNAGDSYDTAVVVTRTNDGGKRYSLDDKYRSKTDEEMASGSVKFNGKLRGDKPSRFKIIDDDNKVFVNWYGTEQKRVKKNVGKLMVGVYAHKNYAEDIVPKEIWEKAKAVAEREGIKYNTIYYDKKKPGMVRFDEAPDFDTAREPIPGKWTWVDTETGEIGKTGTSRAIWHNKWMWVKDDYKGFDVNEAYEWSKTWQKEISNPDGESYKWEYLLKQAGLPVDWTGSALAAEEPTNPDGPKGGKRFSLSDEDYSKAVESGDQKKVVRMVRDAVKAAMPNTKAVDRWGKPRLLYHGTPQENKFYEFNGTIYLSSNRSVANEYTHYRRTFGANPRQTGRIMPVFVNLENPLEIDANRHLWRNIDVEWSDAPVTTRDIEQYAKDNGYDGVIIKRVRDNMYDNDTTAADVYIAFSPEQVKSAGPTYEQKKRSHFPWDDYSELAGEIGATYDNDGNLIPLSERFNLEKKDIRFSLTDEQREAQTHSENFKNWFGDWESDPEDASKVVDENGEPKVVLHGTPNGDFYVFDPEKAGSNTDQGWLGKGFYFYGNAPEYASQYAGKNGRVLKVYLDIKNPYIATVEDFNRLAEANNPEESKRFREQLEEEGYDGVFYNGDLNEEWVAFHPNQIKSATENNGDFSRENPDIRFSLKENEERTLMGMHNITAEKLRSALKLGGLANPSMAVINTEVGGFTNFGEISLIPSSDLIASRTGGNAGTWGADAYSPRFPETHRRLGKGGDKKLSQWVKSLAQQGMRQEMVYNTEEQFNDYYNGFNIRDNALVYPFLFEKGLADQVEVYDHNQVSQRFREIVDRFGGDINRLMDAYRNSARIREEISDALITDAVFESVRKQQGESFSDLRKRRLEFRKEYTEAAVGDDGRVADDVAYSVLSEQCRAYNEGSKFNPNETRGKAVDYLLDNGLYDEYQRYFEQKMQELGAEMQVYAGSDSQGRSKLKPANLEEISRKMKSKGRAGGEGGIFSDGPGAIRAKLLTPMKTLDQIRQEKGRIVNHEQFEKAREEYQDKLRELADTYANGSSSALADILTSGNMAATAKQYGIDLGADAIDKLNKFKGYVRKLPTEYFETKFERPVMLDEFKKAVVPDNLPIDLLGALQRAGLEIVQYPAGDTAARERVTLDAVKNDDSIRFSLSEDAEGWQSEQVSWERSALDHLLQNAARNTESKSLRSQAVQAVNSTLADLLRRISQATDRGAYNSVEAANTFTGAVDKAMNAQRGYDRWTVDSLVSMAKSMLKSGLYDGLRASEVNRLVAKINEGAGREEIQEQMATVFDVLMNANLRGWDDRLQKLMRVRPYTVNSQTGVRTIGQVDKDGAKMLQSMKDGMAMTQEDLESRIAEMSDRLGSDNDIEARDAATALEGLTLAQQYNDLVGKYDADNKAIKGQIREQLEQIYDFWREPNLDEEGNIIYRKDGLMSTTEKRRLKPEFGGLDENGHRTPMTDEAKRQRQQVERVVAALEGKRRENQVLMSEGYKQITDALGGGVAAAVTRAKEFRENEKLRKQEIYHAANSDLLDVDNTTQDIDLSDRSSAANNGILRFFLNPMQTFDKMIRFFGRRSANGEGRLFNKFMRGQAECSHNEWNSFKAGLDEMDAKADELFGMRWMKLGNAMRDGKKFPPIEVTYWDNNNRVTRDLRQDEAAYLYCVNKMRDGQMKLEAMGIDDNTIQQIAQQLDPRLIELADWYQGEFLPKRRDYYNQVYERMFGTSMAHIDNYIHLNINQKSVAQNKELSDRMAGENSPSTITGSLKERKTNVTPIKLHTSLLDLAMQEHQKMEHWAAWGEYNRDLKDLINYGNFRAKVSNLSSKEFGSGSDLLRSFEKCAAIVTGDYQPAGRKSGIDTYAANWAKFVATAKIAFRPFTALKQTLSFPAFMSEARPDDLLKASLNPKGSVEWAMKNLPGFAKRWQSRQAGDTRLMETDSDWNVWRNSTVQKLGRAGLWMNAGVDCLTVAVGARGVYETAKRRYLSYGYSEAKAEKKALEDASIAYNASQQSSEGAFTSAQQTDRTIMSITTTCFRNASMGYERRFTTAVRNLKRMTQNGYREDVIENTKKQMMEEGLTEEQAERAAERVYNRMKWHSMMDIANFGFVLPFLWNLGPALIYILGGNDDEQKKELLRDSAMHAAFGPIEGLTFGGTMSELANIFAGSMLMDGENFKETMQGLRYRNFTPLPIMSDMQGLYGTLSTDAWSGVNDIVNLLVQAGTGVNPETFTDMGVALIDACNGDLDLAKETGFFMMRLANMPKSQVDKIYMDELGLSSEEGAKMSWGELAQRYAKYNARKDAPLAAALISDEAEAAREEKYVNRFWSRVKEKLEKASDEDLRRVYSQGEEQRKMATKEVAKRAGLEKDRYGEKPDKKAKPETAKAIETYQRKRSYSDMAEDVLLQKAKADATQAGDEERAAATEKALSAITEARKSMGVDRKTDERILNEIREARKKALKELKITR